MNKLKLPVVISLILLAAVLAPGCGNDPREDAARQVLDDQLAALQNEDLEGVLSTLHPDGPQYSQTRAMVEQVFALYDLEYDLENVELVDMSEEVVTLRVVQVTRRINGPELPDTRVTVVHTFRKDGDRLKLYESRAESSETL